MHLDMLRQGLFNVLEEAWVADTKREEQCGFDLKQEIASLPDVPRMLGNDDDETVDICKKCTNTGPASMAAIDERVAGIWASKWTELVK